MLADWLLSSLIVEELVLVFNMNYSLWISVGKNGPRMECDTGAGPNPEHHS